MALKFKKTRVSTTKFRKLVPEDELEIMPQSVYIPAEPIYDRSENLNEYDEQQVARVELLMMKGIRSKAQLKVMLDIKNGATLERYIKRVYARWEVFGSTREYSRHRGEGLARIDLLESEMWSKYSNLDIKASPQIALNYLSAISRLQQQRNDMLGLTPKVIAHITAGEDAGSEFSRMSFKHEALTKLVARMNEVIEQRAKVLEYNAQAITDKKTDRS